MEILRGVPLLAVILVLFSSICSGYTGQTPTEQVQIPTSDTGIENIDLNLVTNVTKESHDFLMELTGKIDITDFRGKGAKAIDDLIIFMEITINFTSKVLKLIVDKDKATQGGTNSTVNETDIIDREEVGKAFEYLRFLQEDDPVKAARDNMERNRTRKEQQENR